MENKHTAGKWTVGTTESGPDNCRRAMVYAEFPYDMQETICVASGLNGTEPGETAKANAKLIAAAPELLEALDELLASLSGLMYKSQEQTDTIIAAKDKAAAAINKATN